MYEVQFQYFRFQHYEDMPFHHVMRLQSIFHPVTSLYIELLLYKVYDSIKAPWDCEYPILTRI